MRGWKQLAEAQPGLGQREVDAEGLGGSRLDEGQLGGGVEDEDRLGVLELEPAQRQLQERVADVGHIGLASGCGPARSPRQAASDSGMSLGSCMSFPLGLERNGKESRGCEWCG